MKYLIYSLFFLISVLPEPIPYFLSKFIRFLLQYIVKYRKNVINNNLTSCFPQKSGKEIKELMSRYYRNFAEVLIETVKLTTIRKKSLLKMVRLIENEDFKTFTSVQGNIMIYFSHRGNFEIGSQFLGLYLNKMVYGAYKPFKNKQVEWLWHKLRNRFMTRAIPVRQIVKTIFENEGKGIIYGFLNDQSPTLGDNHSWFRFLGKDTIFFTGPEMIARKFNHPVFFGDLRRIRYGRYEGSLRLLSLNPANSEPGTLTSLYVKALENAIISDPANWLWSHNRWKHHPTGNNLKISENG